MACNPQELRELSLYLNASRGILVVEGTLKLIEAGKDCGYIIVNT